MLMYRHPLLPEVNKPTHSLFILVNPCILQYDLYRKLRVQFLILLMMGAVTLETCKAVNKYLHTVASVGFLFTLNYDARNHELKIFAFTFICQPVNFGDSLKISVNTLLVLRSKYVSYQSGCRELTSMSNVNSRSQRVTSQVPTKAWRNLQHSEQQRSPKC